MPLLTELFDIVCKALSPSPIKEGLLFWLGVFIAPLFYIHSPSADDDADDDPSRSQSYFWLIVPVGFIVATVTVYKKSHLYEHWFFGFPVFTSLMIYFVDVVFGIALGMIIFSKYFQIRRKAAANNLSKYVKSGQITLVWLVEVFMAHMGLIPKVRVLPDWHGRFTAESQISTLLLFLSEGENARDQKSLEFWKSRQKDTEIGGYTFRVSLGSKNLSELSFKEFKSKDYLAIEFWKAKDESEKFFV